MTAQHSNPDDAPELTLENCSAVRVHLEPIGKVVSSPYPLGRVVRSGVWHDAATGRARRCLGELLRGRDFPMNASQGWHLSRGSRRALTTMTAMRPPAGMSATRYMIAMALTWATSLQPSAEFLPDSALLLCP